MANVIRGVVHGTTIQLKESPGMPELRAGLSTIVEIDTGHRRSLLGFHL